MQEQPQPQRKAPRLEREHLAAALSRCPRNERGDPCFQSVSELAEFFDTEDVLALVNKQLYQAEYQQAFHRKRAQEVKELKQQAREQKLSSSAEEPLVATALTRARRLRQTADDAELERIIAEEMIEAAEKEAREKAAEEPDADLERALKGLSASSGLGS